MPLPTLALALVAAFAAQLDPEPPTAPAEPAAPQPADTADLQQDAPDALFGDLVLSDEEARLDLRAAPRLVWALIGEELDDERLAAVVREAPVDRWQLHDDLWLRVEQLPYLAEGWTRVRVRSGSFESEAERLRAEQLLTGLATRLVALQELAALDDDGASDLSAAPPAASSGGGAFAAGGATTGQVYPVWVPAFGLGVTPCAIAPVYADSVAWAYGPTYGYWPSYASAYSSFGYGYGYHGSAFAFSYGGLGHYNHYSLGFHHGFHHGLNHGLWFWPWYHPFYGHHYGHDVVVIIDKDHDDDDDGDDDGGTGAPDPGDDTARRRAQLAEQTAERRERLANADSAPDADDRGARARREAPDLVPVVRREVERRAPDLGGSLMPDVVRASRSPILVSRTSERTGRPPAVRGAALVDRVVRRSAPLAATPVRVGRPSLLPPGHGGSVRTITPSGVVRPDGSSGSFVSSVSDPGRVVDSALGRGSVLPSARELSPVITRPSSVRDTRRAPTFSLPTPSQRTAPTILAPSRSTPSLSSSRSSSLRNSSRVTPSRSSSASRSSGRSSSRSTSSRSSSSSSSRTTSSGRSGRRGRDGR